jgi:signal peptidase I
MLGVMSSITALVLAAFVGYGGAWYVGIVEGNFSLLLFLATVVTGIYWLAERFYFLPQRRQAADLLHASITQRRAELSSQGLRTTKWIWPKPVPNCWFSLGGWTGPPDSFR